MEVVLKEAKRVLMGIMVLDVIFISVSILFSFFTKNTAYSTVYSSIVCYVSFVATGYFMNKYLYYEPIIAQKKLVIFFIIKYVFLFISMGIAVWLGFADFLALFVPLLAPKFTYFIIGIFGKV